MIRERLWMKGKITGRTRHADGRTLHEVEVPSGGTLWLHLPNLPNPPGINRVEITVKVEA